MPNSASSQCAVPVRAKKSPVPTAVVLSLAVAVLWFFPRFWYTKTDRTQGLHWFAERTEISGWRYESEPISDAAEAVLAADKTVNGVFTNSVGAMVRVFSAKRYAEKESEYDMFAHTPDRCWTSVGWKLEPAAPDWIELAVHGVRMRLERRVFVAPGQRELVYFGALVGGQPLPYRLDQYLNVGEKRTEQAPRGLFGNALGALDSRLFGWAWTSFVNRRPLFGPKQFIRISTPVPEGGTAEGDELLKGFLPRWLVLTDYRAELNAWRAAR
jgi:Protein of unknown function (DUF3485)